MGRKKTTINPKQKQKRHALMRVFSESVETRYITKNVSLI